MTGEMVLNDLGRVIAEEWQKTEIIRTNVILYEYVVMPNHFHGIIFITDAVGAHRMRPDSGMRQNPDNGDETAMNLQTQDRAHVGAPLRRQPGSIGSIMAGFKSSTTKQINTSRNNPGCPVWQRNYYERVIRNDYELSRACEYIVNNPIKWELDKENPANHP